VSAPGAASVPGAVSAAGAANADAASLGRVLGTLETVILGKPGQIRLCLACLLARGHLLIEDVPGVGKTTLAHALAHVLGLAWQRVQFTSDLLPADIIGVSVFDRATQRFNFRRGPVFTQLLLADEVNRASPRTQSALLEAMEERQVSADGTTYALPEPFFVVATQNPHEQLGTYALPESQLDRFLMRVTLGYPDVAHERELLRGGERREMLPTIAPALSAVQVLAAQRSVRAVHVADALLDYAQALIARTRERTDLKLGLSPRAGQGLIRAAQSWAFLCGREAVLPEDLQAVLPSVVAHRLERRDPAGAPADGDLAAEIIGAVAVPL
jgi:MoxR-like ATPase